MRSDTIENFNSQFKGIFDCLGQVPTKGMIPTRLYVLGAVFVYQLTLLQHFETNRNLRVGVKPCLQAE